MIHGTPDSGHAESHDCKYTDRSSTPGDTPGGADPSEAHDSDRYVTEARWKGIDQAQRRLPADRGLLAQPLEVPFRPAMLDRPDHHTLVRWIDFDPEHPSRHDLDLIPVPERAQWMLTYLERSPGAARFYMLGLVDDHIVQCRSDLYDLLLGYLVGLSGRHPLRRRELPTGVAVAASAFEPQFVREIVFALVESGRDAEMRNETDRLTSAWCDPEGRERRRCPDPARGSEGIRRSSLERWWSVVSHPDHLSAEIDAYAVAWARAMAMRPGTDGGAE